MHISPRAPKDVWKVIRATKPTVAMIELDEERLNRMRQAPQEPSPVPEVWEVYLELVPKKVVAFVTFDFEHNKWSITCCRRCRYL